MVKGKIFEFVKAPENWEIIQQNGGSADIFTEIKICDDPCDDTDFEIPFSDDKIYAKIVSEESGAPITGLQKLEKNGDSYSCTIEKVPQGGPYMLDIVLFDRKEGVYFPLIGRRRRHFYVGDVYIIAGQSNAAGMGRGTASEEAEQGVHILRDMQYWDIATHPFSDLDYSKQSMFLAFAKSIKRRTGRPVGLIPAAMGGAPLSRWLKDEDGDLYRKLIKTLKDRGISACAVLWYQGCADVWRDGYLERFERFLGFLRADFGMLPVFTFQLNRQKFRKFAMENEQRYSIMREAQRRAAEKNEKVYILPAIDATIMTDFIHCGKASNIMLGERLSLQVLDKLYGIGGGADAPEIKRAYFLSERELKIEFKNVTEFLYDYNADISDYPIKAEDSVGALEIADLHISGDTVTLYLKNAPKGEVFVSGQTGSDPKNIIIDFGTQIPMLCFYRFKAERGAEFGDKG